MITVTRLGARLRAAPLAMALFTALVSSAPLPATTIDPLTFEELLQGADFVGVIECTRAGGIVAHYRVTESWKGLPAGKSLSLRIAVNYWEPQFPIALVGERYVVTAFGDGAPTRIMSTSGGGGVPLWWRQIPADYSLPLFQGRLRLPPAQDAGGTRQYHMGTESFPTLEDMRGRAIEFIRSDPSRREMLLLKGLVKKALRREDDQGPAGTFLKSLDGAVTVEDLIRRVFRGFHEHPGLLSMDGWLRVLGGDGGAETLALFERENVDIEKLSERGRKEVIRDIRKRQEEEARGARSPRRGEEDPAKPKALSAGELSRWRKSLEAPDGPTDDFEELCEAVALHHLLSNSAALSGVEQPGDSRDSRDEADAKAEHRRYVQWFEANRARLKLADPWFEELARQKMD